MDVSVGIWRIIDYGTNLIRVKAVNATNAQITEHLRKCICKFQLEYTNYQFLASRLHREFKEVFKENPENSHEEYRSLITFVETGFKKLCGDQAEYIQDYFRLSHLAREKPRVGIHAVSDEDDVLDIIMMPSVEIGTPKKLEDYLVFMEVCSTGLPYLDNNLPKTVKNSNDYYHAGLNLESIRSHYRKRIRDFKILSRWRNNLLKSKIKDNNWTKMGAKHGGPLNGLYKSHIVIPITFRGHAEKGRLDKSLVEILQLSEDGRSILGFVFADHPETYYFDDKDPHSFDNIDINTMYIFADMISLLVVITLMYTIGSKTCNEYLDLYGEG